MTLRLFNTLTKSKDEFAPLDAANVRLYVCGPTVYDFAHIGNARPAIVFDVLFRLLRHEYGQAHVTYVRNITDVDDKINARAAERGISIRDLTEETAKIYFADVAALGCLEPSITPRATEHIAQMVSLIEKLIAAGHAYAAEGHVLFDVSSKADYGKLANRSLKEMVAGARIEVAPYKKGTMDFVLWKPSNDATPGWDSPWGRGRPGWHIECSAMAGEYLGETFDIHGGGIDLMFPHHENEVAQSEGAHHGHPLAKVWMHNGFLQVEGEKMSKSLDNFITIRDLLTGWRGVKWDGAVLRVNMLKRHYRLPIDWTEIGLRESRKLYFEWREKVPVEIANEVRGKAGRLVSPAIIDALSDDLNTHLALTEIHELSRQVDRSKSDDAKLTLAASLDFLGLLTPLSIQASAGRAAGEAFMHGATASFVETDAGQIPVSEIDGAIEARKAARTNKDFKESDRIRDEMLAKGILLKDGPQGTTWEVKR